MFTAEQKALLDKIAMNNPEMAQVLQEYYERFPESFKPQIDHLMSQSGPYRTFIGSSQKYYFHSFNDGSYRPPAGFVAPISSFSTTSSSAVSSNTPTTIAVDVTDNRANSNVK